MNVRFTNQLEYDFAVPFLNRLQRFKFNVQRYPAEQCVEIKHPILAKLLGRVATDASFSASGATVLLFCTSNRDYWMIVGRNQPELERMLSRVTQFIIPSYAEFSGGDGYPRLQHFDPSQNRLHELGAQLYPNGYYRWESPVEQRQTILERLNLWLKLEEKQQTPPEREKYSYRELHAQFESALAGTNWPEAEALLHQMRRQHLSTAENLKFLYFQLWAQQQHWQKIWQDDTFKYLVRLPLPRAVRGVMLTAFHHSHLLPLEHKHAYSEAFDVFDQHRHELGALLTTRLGITQGPVVRVFAYQALFDGNRASMEQLLALNVDSDIRQCLDALTQLLPPPSPPVTTSPFELALDALDEADYDSAIRLADEIELGTDKAYLLLEVAFCNKDSDTANKALSVYHSLSDAQQARVHSHHRGVKHYLELLKNLATTAQTEDSPTINNWLEWFDQAEADPHHRELTAAVERLQKVTDERFWTEEHLIDLNDKLLNFVTDDTLQAGPYAKRVLQHLTAFFLKDTAFPREDNSYNELYETLLDTMLAKKAVNETNSGMMLRLTEAILRHSPARCQYFREQLEEWFSTPIPALENQVIEAFELLAEYGLKGWQLSNWYQKWVSYLLDLPSARSRVALEVWFDFGKWIKAGDKLLGKLESELTVLLEEENERPIASLPTGYRIGIFTLRASSAERAKQLLLKRNPELDIRISLEKAMNSQVKSLAQHSDMAVIVTTCISHAITYGITPHLQNDPVYPASSGSTSIIRAIEEIAIKLK